MYFWFIPNFCAWPSYTWGPYRSNVINSKRQDSSQHFVLSVYLPLIASTVLLYLKKYDFVNQIFIVIQLEHCCVLIYCSILGNLIHLFCVHWSGLKIMWIYVGSINNFSFSFTGSLVKKLEQKICVMDFVV